MSNFLETYTNGLTRNYNTKKSIGQTGQIYYNTDADGNMEFTNPYTDTVIGLDTEQAEGQQLVVYYDLSDLYDYATGRKNAFDLWKDQILGIKNGIHPANVSFYFIYGHDDSKAEDIDYEWSDQNTNSYVIADDWHSNTLMTLTKASETNRKYVLNNIAVGSTFTKSGNASTSYYKTIHTTDLITCPIMVPSSNGTENVATTFEYDGHSIRLYNAGVSYEKTLSQTYTYTCKVALDSDGNKYITDETFTENITPSESIIMGADNSIINKTDNFNFFWIPKIKYTPNDMPTITNIPGSAKAFETILDNSGSETVYHLIDIFDWE